MADYNPRVVASPTSVGVVDTGLRAYMLRVYNYMLAGLALTGVASWIAYTLAVTSDPAHAAAKLPNGVMLTSIGVTLFTGPLMWVAFSAMPR
jgi:hypothetical protein